MRLNSCKSIIYICLINITKANGNTFRSLTIPKRKWYLWESKSVFVIILTLVDNKSWKKNFLSSYIALSNWIWKIYHIDIILRPKLCQFVQFEISPSMSHKVFILLKITPIYPCILCFFSSLTFIQFNLKNCQNILCYLLYYSL
jgi:hypothetical protein